MPLNINHAFFLDFVNSSCINIKLLITLIILKILIWTIKVLNNNNNYNNKKK